MPSHLSLAQTLSVDVLRSIFEWVTLEQRSPVHEDRYYTFNLRELLTVCSTWRHVSLECLWKKVNLVIDTERSEVRLNYPTLVTDNKLPLGAAGLVREVCINVSISGIVTGVALKLLVNYIGHTDCFPMANKIHVWVTDCDTLCFDAIDKGIVIANVAEFAKLLKSLAPEAKIVDVSCCAGFGTGRDNDINHDKSLEDIVLATLATTLYAGTSRTGLALFSVQIGSQLAIDYNSPLSSLKISFDESLDVRISLLYKSASTLQNLNIGIENANMLFCDLNGQLVLYPNLQHLKLYGYSASQSVASAVATTVVPFPRLRSLKLLSEYPFIDDVLFRGNSATLEYLEICLYKSTIIMLNQWRVFEDRHKSLRHVLIRDRLVYTDDPGNTIVDINKLLNNLVAHAKTLSVGVPRTAMGCVAAAQCGQGFQNIRVFETFSSGLSFFDTLSILNALPALIRLRSGVKGWGPELESIVTEELPGHIISTCAGVGNNLGYWEMVCHNYEPASTTVDYLVLLALICPKLWRIQILPRSIEDSHTKIAEALNSPLYRKYAPRLNKLLDIVRINPISDL